MCSFLELVWGGCGGTVTLVNAIFFEINLPIRSFHFTSIFLERLLVEFHVVTILKWTFRKEANEASSWVSYRGAWGSSEDGYSKTLQS